MPPVPKLTQKDKDTLEEIMTLFKDWYDDSANLKTNIDGILDNELENDEQAFIIKDFNTGLKKNIRKEIQAFDSKLFIQPIFNEEKKSNDYKILKLNQQARNKVGSIKKQLEEIQYMDSIGVSYIWEKLKEKIQKDRIPVVGHNCLYDLTYLYSHMEGHLGKDYEVFKKNIRELFVGGIYDSNIIADYFGMDGENLEAMHEDLHGKESEQLISFSAPEFEVKSDDEHSTGKDAYMTGFAFINLVQSLEKKIVNSLLNVVTINPNVLYAYNFGSETHDVCWNQNTWVAFCKKDFSKQFRLMKNAKSDKIKTQGKTLYAITSRTSNGI